MAISTSQDLHLVERQLQSFLQVNPSIDVVRTYSILMAGLPGYITVEDLKSVCRHMGLQQIGPDEYASPHKPFLGLSGLAQQYAQQMQQPTLTVAPPPQVDPGYNQSAVGRRKFKDGDQVEIAGGTNDHGFPTETVGKITGFNSPYYLVTVGDREVAIVVGNLRAHVPKKKISLDSVIISAGKKEEIRAAIAQVKHQDLIFDEWGFGDVFEKGTAISLLFWGIPGTGKTLMAQAIADEVGGELQIITTAEIESSEPGGAEREIKAAFAVARKKSKEGKQQVLLFDECDSLLTDRNELGPILGAQVNCLLGEIEKYEGIIIFTTNRLGKLDPALNRRITAKIEFEFPNRASRREIWKRMIPKKAPLDKDVDLEHLSEHAIAGGNIKNAVLNAARIAAFRGDKKLRHEHFQEAIEKEMKGLQAFISEYEKTSHQTMVGHVSRSPTGVGITKKATMKKTEGIGGDNAL